MRVLIATDAWRPHICGVVTTLEALAVTIPRLGSTVEFITPEEFRRVLLPTYPGLQCALPRPRGNDEARCSPTRGETARARRCPESAW